MSGNRARRWLQAVLLLTPIFAIVAWLVGGGTAGRFGPAPDGDGVGAGAADTEWSRLPGFPKPSEAYPADRLHERVDGAADALIAAGCSELLFWRWEDPPAELELLVFEDSEGASRTLKNDAGADRTQGPGNEAWVGEGAVLFRRGRLYARLMEDPESPADSTSLLSVGTRLDGAILRSEEFAP